MNYPLISEYIEAIKSAEHNLNQLNDLRPVLDNHGNPIMSCGNNSVVFKMESVYPHSPSEFYALKCFTKDQEGRSVAYKQIKESLKDIHSDYLVYFEFFENEIYVATDNSESDEFPVLLMDWVEGKTLDFYLRENINDTYILEVLTHRFSLMAEWLLNQPFAHGDLQPDNIIISPGCRIKLIDYDGMFVPLMNGQKAREVGSPDFQHPERTTEDFNSSIDDFSLISILLSLKAISIRPELLASYGAKDRLLLSCNDYQNFRKCPWLNEGTDSDQDYAKLISLFQFALSQKYLKGIRPETIAIKSPLYNLSTSTTEYEKRTSEEDEYGNIYSKDGLKLIEGKYGEFDSIRQGTKVICDNAFHNEPQDIIIPEGVEVIGKDAFSFRSYFDDPGFGRISIPETVRFIGESALRKCRVRKLLSPCFKMINDNVYSHNEDRLLRGFNGDISSKVRTMDKGAFSYSEIKYVAIPNGVKTIPSSAFAHCNKLENVLIPDSVTDIMYYAFKECGELHTIVIPNSIRRIEGGAFADCSKLRNIIIPNTPIFGFHISPGVDGLYIDNEAFEGCFHLNVFYTSGEKVTSFKGYFFGGELEG